MNEEHRDTGTGQCTCGWVIDRPRSTIPEGTTLFEAHLAVVENPEAYYHLNILVEDQDFERKTAERHPGGRKSAESRKTDR